MNYWFWSKTVPYSSSFESSWLGCTCKSDLVFQAVWPWFTSKPLSPWCGVLFSYSFLHICFIFYFERKLRSSFKSVWFKLWFFTELPPVMEASCWIWWSLEIVSHLEIFPVRSGSLASFSYPRTEGCWLQLVMPAPIRCFPVRFPHCFSGAIVCNQAFVRNKLLVGAYAISLCPSHNYTRFSAAYSRWRSL